MRSPETVSASAAIDIGELLDSGTWNAYQKSVVAMAALAIVFDGFDNQALGFAIPALSKAWGLAPQAFKSVAAIGLVGMTIGTAIAGVLGDRFGRRRALIGSVLLFGLLTMATATATDLASLTLLRFFAGVGLGGAMPNAAAIAAEFSPVRNRPMAVTLTIVCVPLGGLLGGLLAAWLLPAYGWQALFVVAGLAPTLLAAFLAAKLPESPRFLVKAAGTGALRVVLRRLGHDLADDARLVDAERSRTGEAGVAAIFGPGLRRDTIGIWSAFFLCLISVYTVFNWVPATLSAAGFDAAMSSLGLAAFNLGGVAGAIGAAWVIGRLGSRTAMLSLSAAAVVVAMAIAALGIADMGNAMLVILLALLGLSINGVQTTMFALAAHLYPSAIRSTGVGSALAFGRIGAILSAYVGAAVLASGGGARFFILLALAMAGTFVALSLIRNHIPTAAKPA